MHNQQTCVLVCDDDEGIIDVTKIVLSEKGYKVVTMMSGKEVLEKIKSIQPKVILMDLWMPDMNGDVITRQLKDDDTTKDIPIIIVSASKDTQKVAMTAGADDFLCKPFDISELEEKVEKYTQKN